MQTVRRRQKKYVNVDFNNFCLYILDYNKLQKTITYLHIAKHLFIFNDIIYICKYITI